MPARTVLLRRYIHRSFGKDRNCDAISKRALDVDKLVATSKRNVTVNIKYRRDTHLLRRNGSYKLVGNDYLVCNKGVQFTYLEHSLKGDIEDVSLGFLRESRDRNDEIGRAHV